MSYIYRAAHPYQLSWIASLHDSSHGRREEYSRKRYSKSAWERTSRSCLDFLLYRSWYPISQLLASPIEDLMCHNARSVLHDSFSFSCPFLRNRLLIIIRWRYRENKQHELGGCSGLHYVTLRPRHNAGHYGMSCLSWTKRMCEADVWFLWSLLSGCIPVFSGYHIVIWAEPVQPSR